MTDKTDTARCELCGEPMPPGEEAFKCHGFSGPCPKPAAAPTPPAQDPREAALVAMAQNARELGLDYMPAQEAQPAPCPNGCETTGECYANKHGVPEDCCMERLHARWVEAGDGTLHGAIDHWHERALKGKK